MKKILVTTDFSANSKKGIHFAMQLATQTKCQLIFYNVVEIYRPSIWDTMYYDQFEAEELQKSMATLKRFVHTIHQKSALPAIDYTCVCQAGLSSSNQIISYAKEVAVDYICVSTVGAGSLTQLFGTTASELIAFCPIPLFIIPKNYKSKTIKNVFFASDFKNFDEELTLIEKFAEPVKAQVDVYHYDYKAFIDMNRSKFGKLVDKYSAKVTQFHLKQLDALYPLIAHMKKDIAKVKPSIVVMFTKQNRNWFSRLFLASLSVEMAFDTTTPLLIFRKHLPIKK
jgi:nucleotide-binding universal stress UspA family protein